MLSCLYSSLSPSLPPSFIQWFMPLCIVRGVRNTEVSRIQFLPSSSLYTVGKQHNRLSSYSSSVRERYLQSAVEHGVGLGVGNSPPGKGREVSGKMQKTPSSYFQKNTVEESYSRTWEGLKGRKKEILRRVNSLRCSERKENEGRQEKNGKGWLIMHSAHH